MFGLTILGNNSAIPAFDRHPTAQILTFADHVFLIDCGEGTQSQIANFKIRKSRINHIFISHLHGDHYFGLIGLLSSMVLGGRENPLNLYAPPQLEEIIQLQFEIAKTSMDFEFNFHPLKESELLVDHDKFTIESFPVMHRIPCWGFVFREKRLPRKINKDLVQKAQVPTSEYYHLQKGNDYIYPDGGILKNELVTTPNTKGKSYAYCADTCFYPPIARKIEDVDLMYHETTYLHELQEKAALRFHSTTIEAASMAKMAGAKKLLIGHFSSKYYDLEPFLTESKTVFENTDLALEGATYLF